VLLYHADLGWIPGGFLGVEVFFVISGYLITLLLVNEHEQNGRISLRRFWFRRARRLLPAAYALLLVVSLTVVLFVREQAEQTRGDVVAGLTYTTNWYLVFTGQSYFQSFGRRCCFTSVAGRRGQFYLGVAVLVLLLVVCRRRLVHGHPDAGHGGRLHRADGGALQLHRSVPCLLRHRYRAGDLVLGATLALFWRPSCLRRGRWRKADPRPRGPGGLGAPPSSWPPSAIGARCYCRGGFLLVGLATLLHRQPPTRSRS
jgi:peptidoglycan/LPS O-acetylase OafA/YrhL